MKTFEVMFIKNQLVKSPSVVPVMAKQIIHSVESTLTIPVPDGYSVFTVTEILEPVTLQGNGKTNNLKKCN